MQITVNELLMLLGEKEVQLFQMRRELAAALQQVAALTTPREPSVKEASVV